jgi:hypothetical protein
MNLKIFNSRVKKIEPHENQSKVFPLGQQISITPLRILQTLICFVTIFPVRFVLLNLSLIPTAASAYLIEAVLKPNEKPAG